MSIVGTEFPIKSYSDQTIEDFLRKIDGVYSKTSSGQKLWFIESDKTKHISKLIKEQKSGYFEKRTFHSSSAKPAKDCFYKDNYVYKYKR